MGKFFERLCNKLCCCCCFGKSRTHSRDLAKFGRNLEKKYAKSGRNTTYAKYGTNWETLVNEVQTPSQIEDLQMTMDVKIDPKKYKNREDIYKFMLKDYDYSPEDRLGKGGYGEVFKIRDKKTGEWKAVKVMKLKGEKDFSRHRFDMFKAEVFALRKTPHKNIIRLIDHSMASNVFLCFLIMEYAEGGDLNKRLKNRYKQTNRAFPEEEAKCYFVQMVNALHFVHSKRLIHGDLKLDNVLIVKQKGTEIIKVTDFGCARVAIKEEEGIVKTVRAVGTIAYMAPEQLRVYIAINLNRPDFLQRKTTSYNPIRADVWSLGVCLYRMFFYVFPFHFDSKNELVSLKKMLTDMKHGYDMPEEEARELSKDASNIMSEIMEYNKNKRLDMKTVMTSKWIHNSPLLDKPQSSANTRTKTN